MNKTLLAKILILILGLVVVLKFRSTMSSQDFINSINSLFGTTKPANTLNWCADHVVDFAWVSAEVPEKLKTMDMADLREKYCVLTTEPISDVDLSKVEWSKLAESGGATGQKTVLEWNKALNLFRAGGMPFKSSVFGQELSP